MQLVLKNVRSFAEPGPIPLRPLTLLVGENSAGKSSFLALLRIAFDIGSGNAVPSFNREPFFLGAFDQIAHVRAGAAGRSKFFEIGLTIDIPSEANLPPLPTPAALTAKFEKRGSQPALTRFEVLRAGSGLTLNLDGERARLDISTPGWSGEDVGAESVMNALSLSGEGTSRLFQILSFFAEHSPSSLINEKKVPVEAKPVAEEALKGCAKAMGAFAAATHSGAYAIAPVRSKPERTYNPVEYLRQAEGSHVPMVLAKSKFSSKPRWDRVRLPIESFGQAAGLFDAFNVKTMGRSDSDPFQLEVKTGGRFRNIIDVGYGVSQVLPIIVDLVDGEHKGTFLLQQPEVHLHPRGQAALGTFLCGNAAKGNRLIVETHSDYLINRVRAEVRNSGTIKPDQVGLLYFERAGAVTQIHQIGLDEQGNLVRPPDSYRQFFLEETASSLGF